MADDSTYDTDYLGRRVPVALTNKASLPVGGVPVPGSAGPASVSAASGPTSQGATGGLLTTPTLTTTSEGVAVPGGVATASPDALSLLRAGGSFADLAQRAFSSPPAPPGSGEPGSFDVPADIPPGSFTGAEGVPSFAGAGAALQEGLPIFGALSTIARDLGEGDWQNLGAGAVGAALGSVIPGIGTVVGFGAGALIEKLLDGFFGGPSERWTSFPGRLQQTLQATERANQGLAEALANVTGDDQISGAIRTWRDAIRAGGVGNFGEGAGAFDLSDEPGAGGGLRQGRAHDPFSADFSPELAGLRAEVASARSGAPAKDRLAALTGAMTKSRDASQAERDARQAALDAQTQEWQRTYDPGTGSE